MSQYKARYRYPLSQCPGTALCRLDVLDLRGHPEHKLPEALPALDSFITRFRRLYEQKASSQELWHYVVRWTNWLWGGLYHLCTFKGGRKRYFYLAVLLNHIEQPSLSEAESFR